MLSTLHIKNIGIIDDLSINFEEGFNVLTGETGAGKTLIIGSLAIPVSYTHLDVYKRQVLYSCN